MQQKTLFDVFESAEKSATSEGRKRHRYDKEIDNSYLKFSNREQNAAVEQVLPSQFFSLFANELCKSRAFRNQREEILFALKNQGVEKNWSWNRFQQGGNSRPLSDAAASHPAAQDIYRNSIVDIASDSSGQIFLALQRSGLNLFSSSVPCGEAGLDTWNGPVLRLDAATIQEHRTAHQGRAFCFSCSQFIDESLFAACGYLGNSALEVFDLEDVEETTCDPVCSFQFNRMQRIRGVDNLFLEQDAPFATDIITSSSTLLTAALSSGESAWIDLRQKAVIQCTPRVGTRSRAQGLLDMRSFQQRPSPLSSIAFCHLNASLLLTGSKDGRVSLWDVRFPKEFIVTYRSQSEIARLWTYTGDGKRTGCPQVWFNNFRGDIIGLAMTDVLFSEIFSVKTEDSARDNFSNNIATQKIALSSEGFLFYPHLSRNCIFVLDIEAGVRSFPTQALEAVSVEKNVLRRSDTVRKSSTGIIGDPMTRIDDIVDSTTLGATFSFLDTGVQISACSIFDDQLSLLVGSSIGDVCMIKNNFAY